MNLFTDLKSELDQESGEESVRLSLGLSGRVAEAFLSLHELLGGQTVISRNALGVRILTRALMEGEPRKQRRAVKDESLLHKEQASDLKGEDL